MNLNKIFNFLQPTPYNLQPNRGFTLLELLLSVAAIGILAGLSVPIYTQMLAKNDLDIAVSSVGQSARRAQVLSQGVDGDITWGIRIESGFITLFKGATYATRDINYDETFTVPSSIGVSGTAEYIFAKFTGLPSAVGTTTLSTSVDSRSVVINAKGMVQY